MASATQAPSRGRRTARAIEQAVAMAPEPEKLSATQIHEAQHKIDTITNTIRSTYSKIKDVSFDIGREFFELKKYIDGLTPDYKRAMKIQSFTAWMNAHAEDKCGMSTRWAWTYYRAYAEAQAAGLEDRTIRALAPSVLKNESARKAIVRALTTRPELATQLNEASSNPRAIREVAKTPEFQAVLERVSAAPAEPKSAGERISRFIVSTLKHAFRFQDEDFDLVQANEALNELTEAVQNAAAQLGVGAHVSVSTTPIHREELKKKPAVPTSRDVPLPVTDAQAVENLVAAIRSGAATVVSASPRT